MDGVMPASNVNKRPERGLALRRALAGLLCLALLLAGLIHTGHADAPSVAATFEFVGLEGEPDHHRPAGHSHAAAPSCSLAHACTMSATLAGLAILSPLPEAPVGLGDARLHRGLDRAPRPHPPKLSAAV
jgi:hypothetical protein